MALAAHMRSPKSRNCGERRPGPPPSSRLLGVRVGGWMVADREALFSSLGASGLAAQIPGGGAMQLSEAALGRQVSALRALVARAPRGSIPVHAFENYVLASGKEHIPGPERRRLPGQGAARRRRPGRAGAGAAGPCGFGGLEGRRGRAARSQEAAGGRVAAPAADPGAPGGATRPIRERGELSTIRAPGTRGRRR